MNEYDGPGIRLADYPSISWRDHVYFIVESTNDGSWYCTCPGWTTSKKKPKSCKHLRDYMDKHGDPVIEEPD